MDRKFVLKLFLLFAFSTLTFAKENGPLPAPWVDWSDVECGYVHDFVNQDRIIENTRRQSPQLSATLSKTLPRTQFEVGDVAPFYVSNFVEYKRDTLQAECRYKGDSLYIFVERVKYLNGSVTQDDVDRVYRAFELQTPEGSLDPNRGIRSILEGVYGKTPNKTKDGYVYILIYDIKDGYSENSGGSYIAGYFSSTDQRNVDFSNQKDLIYIDCDPARPYSDQVLSVVAHEFQHLIHYGQDSNESSGGLWVNEGASEYASFLCGYGLRYPSRYFRNPDRSLVLFGDYYGDDLVDYEKVALWTYYLGEKFGPELIGDIVKEPKNSIEGVKAALQKRSIELSVEQIFDNFCLANYLDAPELNNGYWGYSELNLNIRPQTLNHHQIYPVDEQVVDQERYAVSYIKFSSRDSTAALHFQISNDAILNPQILSIGDSVHYSSISLDEERYGNVSLAMDDQTAEILFVPTTYDDETLFSYRVESEIQDIRAPQIVWGPYESLPTGQSVTITWETDEFATSIVEYGLTPEYGNTVQDNELKTHHEVVLDNLESDMLYHYRIGSSDNQNNGPRYSVDFTFRTQSMRVNAVANVQQTHSYGYQGRNMVRDNEGTLYLFYHDLVGERRYIYVTVSDDDGQTWTDPTRLDDTLYYSGMPGADIDSQGRLHVAWHAQITSDAKFAIYYSRSDDKGQTWSTPTVISTLADRYDRLYAAVAIDSKDNPHIVWNSAIQGDSNIGDVYYSSSDDGGQNWATDMVVSQSTQHRCFVPTIDLTSKDEIYVVYVDGDFEKSNRDAFVITSQDGIEWSDPFNVSKSGVLYEGLASFVIDHKDVAHVVYSDNFTPGDIRIMHTKYLADEWTRPMPATSARESNVNYPNIAADTLNTLYLVYRDDMSVGASGKLIAKFPNADHTEPKLKKSVAEQGEAFMTLFRNNNWSPAINLSQSSMDTDFPELPKQAQPGSIDIIWIDAISGSSNRITHLYFDATPDFQSAPLQVVSVKPEPGSENISYFKDALEIIVRFDQRVISDSLIPDNVIVTSEQQGLISGDIVYQTDQKQMIFRPFKDLLPNDIITVRLRSVITNEAGKGLDGNRNGALDKSPEDDYVWSFQTRSPDVSGPVFTIGIHQHPVFTKYMDIFIVPSEELSKNPTLLVNGVSLAILSMDAESPLYKAEYELSQSGTLDIHASGTDLAGQSGNSARTLSAQLFLANTGGEMESPDHRLKLSVNSFSLSKQTFLTLSKEPDTLVNNVDQYRLGPVGLRFDEPIELEYTLSQANLESGKEYLFQIKNNGNWEDLETRRQGGGITTQIERGADIRVIEGKALDLASELVLLQNYPNPFSPSMEYTLLTVHLPKENEIELAIFNILGHPVKMLVQGKKGAGLHHIQWSGKDNRDRRVPTGLYFARLKVKNNIYTQKIIVLQ